MNIDIFIPVRLKSTRLPKKVIKIIENKPIIQLLIERLSQSKNFRKIIVCTTNNKSDDELISILNKIGVNFFRGHENDLLSRYLSASKEYNTDFIISVDGDDIYTDPKIIDKIISDFKNTKADYIKIENVPLGMAPVGIKKTALEKICKMKTTDNTATGYKNFFENSKLFNVRKVSANSSLSFSKNMRLTLDYEEDFKLATIIFKELGNYFHLEDLMSLFKRKPELIEITKNLEKRYLNHWNQNVADSSLKDI